jgi:zinc protease
VITKDAAGLRQQLLADTPSEIHYDAPKPDSLLAEDREIGALRLKLAPDAVTVTPVESVFTR